MVYFRDSPDIWTYHSTHFTVRIHYSRFAGLVTDDPPIVLKTASDITRFSFMVQDSISYLDLRLCANPGYFSPYCDCRRSKNERNFVNTGERCRQFFAPRRRILYTLNLDFTKERECSLQGDVDESKNPMLIRECCESPHISKITVTKGFHDDVLTSFIEEALSISIPKENILKCIVKISDDEGPLLSRIGIKTASKFLDCFYPEVTDAALLSDFIKQFHVVQWMEKNENPEILEFLLYHARRLGNKSLDDETDCRLITLCYYNIQAMHYRNIRPMLNYVSDSSLTCYDYVRNLLKMSSERPCFAKEDAAMEWLTFKRRNLLNQIYSAYGLGCDRGDQEAASETLRLIWSSVPDACLTFGEFKDGLSFFVKLEKLRKAFDFYVEAVGEFHEHIEPRSLKHLCRTALRRKFRRNGLWIPDAIRRTGLPKSLQSFLNLEKSYSVA